MGALAGLMGAGAPIAQGATQGQLQGTQEQLNLQQAQKQRDLSQQSIDVERLKAMAELTGPARGEALKRGLELEQGKPDNFGYWESQVTAGKMSREDADKAEQAYQQQIDSYKSFGLGSDANVSGVAGLHPPSASSAAPPPPPGLGQNAPALGTNGPSSNPAAGPGPGSVGPGNPPNIPNTPPSSTPDVKNFLGTTLGMALGNAGVPFGGSIGQAAAGALPAPAPFNPRPSTGNAPGGPGFGLSLPQVSTAGISPGTGAPQGAGAFGPGIPQVFGPNLLPPATPTAAAAPTPTAPATAPVPPAVLPNAPSAAPAPVPPDNRAAVPSAPVADGPRADEHIVYQAGGISVVSGPDGTRVIDPKGALTPWTQADTENYIANDKGVQAAQALVTSLSAQIDAARKFGPPSTVLMKSLQDAQDKLVAAQESAVTRAQGEATIRANGITAFYSGYNNAGGGTAQFAQANRTRALLPGEQAKQDADLAYTRAQTSYQQAQTDAEKQAARQAMYDADLKRQELKNYPAEEAQKLAKMEVDIATARIGAAKSSLDFRTGKLANKDHQLVEDATHLWSNITDRDINGLPIGVGSVRFGGAEGGPGINASLAWSVVIRAQAYLNDPDPDVRLSARNIYNAGLQALKAATTLRQAGGDKQVRGDAPSYGAWAGKDLWDQFHSVDAYVKASGGNPQLPSVRNNIYSMSLWHNFVEVQGGHGPRNPDAFAGTGMGYGGAPGAPSQPKTNKLPQFKGPGEPGSPNAPNAPPYYGMY